VGTPALKVLLDAGVRSVQSTPLINSKGDVLGMISTHFKMPHRLRERELRLLDVLAGQAATYLERQYAEKIEVTLNRELQHRTKNLLAVIQAIALRSLRGEQTLAEASEKFEGRLQALARAQDRIANGNAAPLTLKELVTSELKPFAGRIAIEGERVELDSRDAQNFALALHELATNAAKYGALSTPVGEVRVAWRISKSGQYDLLKFSWKERHGPPTVASTREGFGTTLIKSIFKGARLDYATDGFGCEIETHVTGTEAAIPVASTAAST
jgi:two-component sensor histidine kinase